MPWRLQAMKDVAACDKLRGVGKRALIRRYPNGETHPCIDGFRERFVGAVSDDKSRTKTNERDGLRWRVMYAGVAQAEYIGLVRRTR